MSSLPDMSLLISSAAQRVAAGECNALKRPLVFFFLIRSLCCCVPLLSVAEPLVSLCKPRDPFYRLSIQDSPRSNVAMADAWGNGGQAGQFPLEQWFYEMPLCTRWWTSATVITSLLVQCHFITPFQLFYSFRAVFVKSQVSYDKVLDNIAPGAFLTVVAFFAVLAAYYHIPLLRSFEPRPPLPRLVSPTILAITRRVLRELTRRFLLAPLIRHVEPPRPLAHPLPSVPRILPIR